MKEYKWRGLTYQIADEDLDKYPGAILIGEPVDKAAAKPKNKARKPAKNKEKEN